MKKMIIAACAVALATVAQAATVNWSCDEILVAGNKDLWSGTYPTANQFDIYVYSSKDLGGSTYGEVVSAIQAGTGASWLEVADGKALGSATLTGGTGAFAINGTTATDYTTDAGKFVDLFAIIVDKTADQYAFVVEEEAFRVGQTAVAGKLNNTGLGPDYAGFVFAGDYKTANWYAQAVPEPTSGLLLLLGVAGLALRRRRA